MKNNMLVSKNNAVIVTKCNFKTKNKLFIVILFSLLTIACTSEKRSNNLISQLDSSNKTNSNSQTEIDVTQKVEFILNEEPENLDIIRKAYSQANFTCSYDEKIDDYRILIKNYAKTTELIWSDGQLIPESELTKKDMYRNTFYKYPYELADPANFSDEEIERMKNFGSASNRQTAAISAPFLINAVFDTGSRATTEEHLVTVAFPNNKRVSVHEYIAPILREIVAQMYVLAETDSEVSSFINTLGQTDGYAWREIRDTSGRSYHSFGLAVDLLPQGWGQKIVYWSWRKDVVGDNWVITPLSRRWMPPKAVIDLFEANGFIWGGKWAVWDNMHFEYRPELLLYREKTNSIQ